jgi:hypothetical protein
MGQPLDPGKAFFYGRFVQAAYTMFKNPQGGDPLRPEPAGIPDGYELGAWIHMSDFILNLKDPQFYGIVVHGIENPDSRVIAIRGTEHLIEWIDDAFAIPIPFRRARSQRVRQNLQFVEGGEAPAAQRTRTGGGRGSA